MSMRLVSLVVVLALAGCNDTDRGLGVLSVPAVGDIEAAELDDGQFRHGDCSAILGADDLKGDRASLASVSQSPTPSVG